MTARSHTRTMHKLKKQRAVAHLRWRLRTQPQYTGHRNNNGKSPGQSRRDNDWDYGMETRMVDHD